MSKCEHLYRIFSDPDAKGTGNLTFYCQKCLDLQIKKKVYKVTSEGPK